MFFKVVIDNIQSLNVTFHLFPAIVCGCQFVALPNNANSSYKTLLWLMLANVQFANTNVANGN